MHNMDARSRLATYIDQERDGLLLRGGGSRRQIGFITLRILSGDSRCRVIDRPGQLRVNEKGCTNCRELARSLSQICGRNMWELHNAGVDEKTFETACTRVDHRTELASVPRDHAAPQRDVHSALPFEHRDFLPETGQCR